MAPSMEHDCAERASIGQDLHTTTLLELILPIVATLAVVLRLGLRQQFKIRLGWDDLLIAVSIPFLWGLWGVELWRWPALSCEKRDYC